MKYSHSFQVHASLATVANFHAQASSLSAITPPPVVAQIHQAQRVLKDGDMLDFTLWLGPLPLHWVARIENVNPTGFTDRQLRGPFQQWVHRHHFVRVDETTTEVVDEIEIALQKHPWWGVVGLGMWLTLPLLFAYRGWKTKQLLEKNQLTDWSLEHED